MSFWVIKQRLKRFLEQFSGIYIKLLKWKHRGTWFVDRIVSKQTDIVIEGFPRSSNSFAVKAFKTAQDYDVKIATHTHSYAQIIEAVKFKKPTLVLIRKPNECIISLKALNMQVNAGDEKMFEKIDIREYLLWYIDFYSALLKHRENFVIATFEEVTSNYSSVLIKLNEKFKTNFKVFQHTTESTKSIFESSNFHLSPSKKRDVLKEKIEIEFYLEKNKILVNKAMAVYNAFLKDE
jgi:hypothetical protein